MDKEGKIPLTLGVDLGGTKVKIALVDAKGKILSVHKYPTNAKKGPKKVISDLKNHVHEYLNKVPKKILSLGIGIAGQVDLKGVVQYAPNLHWRNVLLKEQLEDSLGMRVVVINDVRAATWGEWGFGAGIGINNLVVLFIGTGIGGGVVNGGNMLIGCNNIAGELGHTTLVINGRKCHCPNFGCLEAYAGGWAIAERAQEAVRADPKAGEHLLALAKSIENIEATTVSQAFREGNKLAHRLVEETVGYLAAGMVSIVNTFNPSLIVLGGGVIEGLPEQIGMIEQATRRKALEAAIANLKFVKAALGDNSGVIGAATLAQTKVWWAK